MKYIVLTLAALGCLGMGLTNAMSEKEQQNLARLLKESPNGFRNALVKLVQQDQENKKGILADAYNVVKNSQRGKETFDKIVRSIIKNKNTADDLLEQLKSGDADKLKLTKKVKDLEDELDILKGITGAKPEDAKKIKDLEQEIQDLKDKISDSKKIISDRDKYVDELVNLIQKRGKEIEDLKKKLLAKLDQQLKNAIKAVDDALVNWQKTPSKGKKGEAEQIAYDNAKKEFDKAVNDFKNLNAVEGYDENLIKNQVDEAAGLKFEETEDIAVEEGGPKLKPGMKPPVFEDKSKIKPKVNKDKTDFINALKGIDVATLEAEAKNETYGSQGDDETNLKNAQNALLNQIAGLPNYGKYKGEAAALENQIKAVKLPAKKEEKKQTGEDLIKKITGGNLPATSDEFKTIFEDYEGDVSPEEIKELRKYWQEKGVDPKELDKFLLLA